MCPYKVRGKECVPRASPCWPSLCGQLPPDPNLPARAAATARATATMACASATLAGRATTAPPSRSAHTSATCKVSRNRKHENRTAGRGGHACLLSHARPHARLLRERELRLLPGLLWQRLQSAPLPARLLRPRRLPPWRLPLLLQLHRRRMRALPLPCRLHGAGALYDL